MRRMMLMPTQDQRLVMNVQNGRLNKSEFRTLNAARNQIERLRAKHGRKGGKINRLILSAAEEKYHRMEKAFLTKDVYVPGKGDKMTDKLFNGIRSGEITNREAHGYMSSERNITAQKGGVFSKLRQLRNHSHHLERISTNGLRMPRFRGPRFHYGMPRYNPMGQAWPSPAGMFPAHGSMNMVPAPRLHMGSFPPYYQRSFFNGMG